MWLELGLALFSGSVISRQTTIDATKREIAAAKSERDNHFVNLRESARRGGFNPLTALRATGGGGYGQYVPLLSRSAVGEGNRAMGQFASNFIRDAAFMGANQAHERTMTRMNNDAAMERTQTQIANRPKSGFDYSSVDRIKVKFGGKTLELKSNIARRLDILPGDDLMPGDLSEIGGEFWGEVISALGTEAAAEVLGVEITDLLNDDTGQWSIDKLVEETRKAINNTPIGTLTRGWTDAGKAMSNTWTWLKEPNPNAMKTTITRGRQDGGKAGM